MNISSELYHGSQGAVSTDIFQFPGARSLLSINGVITDDLICIQNKINLFEHKSGMSHYVYNFYATLFFHAYKYADYTDYRIRQASVPIRCNVHEASSIENQNQVELMRTNVLIASLANFKSSPLTNLINLCNMMVL
jgi:hypothetical protein